MLTIIDQGGFKAQKEYLDTLHIQSKQTITLILSENGHTIEIDKLRFQLNYRDQEYQRMLPDSSHALYKAIGTQKGSVLDACGGLGKEGLLMAHKGFQVSTCESNPVLYTLLSQAIDQYLKQVPLNWQHYHTPCQDLMQKKFDIVYLDPMFQVSRSAKPQKSMQVIQNLASDTPFLDWTLALQCAQKRLIIKQHQKSPIIKQLPKPDIQIKGKRSVRYDIYTI